MAFLILEDGTVYEGKAFGNMQNTIGEVVFNTGMTGYEAILTDPTNFGQIVAMTYPLIGNYGINFSDLLSSKVHVKGLVVRELCDEPCNWASEGTLENFLKINNISGIEGIDTRALTRKIRESGTMRGMISMELPTDKDYKVIKEFDLKNAVESVSCKEKYQINNQGKLNVAVIDYGINNTILNSLTKRNSNLTVYPFNTTAEEIIESKPDGIILSNGPGNPKDNEVPIKQIKKLIGFRPIFGISLGHQILALAHGIETEKLTYGHRGSNYPVKDLKTEKVYITSQNHSYTLISESLKDAEVTHINWNDKTCEGVRYLKTPSFGVEFIPEVCFDSYNCGYLFDLFVTEMNNFKK